MIRKSNDSQLQLYEFTLSINDWISFLDYLHTFGAEYEFKRVEEIYNSVPKILSENLNKHYDARHKHHIECLMDGIVKTRCMLEKDMSFHANEDDYKLLKEVWFNIIKSWLNPEEIKKIDLKERIFFLPENCQFLYWKICEKKKSLNRQEVEEIALNGMSKQEYYEAWNILLDMGLIIENNGVMRPYFLSEIKDDENQFRL
jgi:hypothetical protein